MTLCREKGVKVFPMDNEHTAIDECLKGEKIEDVESIILTASGGPFYGREDRDGFSLEEAIQHPNHVCGKKVAINCSTLMNKGLEILQAKHLF